MMSPPPQFEFFLVTLPGFEDLAAKELTNWFPSLEGKIETGGVSVQTDLPTGLSLNMALKIPTRILLRADSFRCRDFPKLYKRVAELNWRQWIDSRCELAVEVSSRESRLKIKKRIEKTCLDGWAEFQKKHTGKEKKAGLKATLFVRLHKDICTLSLDTSGERLHKRGVRKHIGEAPLRETIAAALIDLVSSVSDSGAKIDVEVVDPMMGSGTFLIEAAVRDRPITDREFAAFRLKPQAPPRSPELRERISGLVGFEQDAKTVAAAAENLKSLKLDFEPRLHHADLFGAEPLGPAKNQRWLFCNPPYGERIKINDPAAEYYARLFAAAERLARPGRACFIIPAPAAKGRLQLPPEWKVLTKKPFSNGGIAVVAFVFGRR